MECVAFVTRSIESRIFSTVFNIFFLRDRDDDVMTRSSGCFQWRSDSFLTLVRLIMKDGLLEDFFDALPKYVVDVWMNKYCFITQRTRNFHKLTQFEMRWSCVEFWCARRLFFWLDFNSLLRQQLLRSQWLCSIKSSSFFAAEIKSTN